MLKLLEDGGRAKNTIVVMTSDNGMPFPRAKANLYDAGTRMPLAIRWPARVKGGRRTEAFASHCDFAPTFLEAAGLPVPAEMTGRSLLPLLLSDDAAGRDRVFFGRERHANVREGDLSYPARAIRTAEWLLIRNLRPEAWPAGDPKKWKAVGDFGDCDGGPSKEHVLAHRDEGSFFKLAFEKRPAVELFEIARDPAQLTNVAAQHPDVVAKLEAALIEWLTKTGDPRVSGAALGGEDPRWDKYPYFGN
jgi:arylsulfatase A-like enzyme